VQGRDRGGEEKNNEEGGEARIIRGEGFSKGSREEITQWEKGVSYLLVGTVGKYLMCRVRPP